MRSLKLKRLGAVLGATALMVNASACGVNRSATEEQNEETSDITFAWWGSGERNSYTLDGIDVFEQLYNGIDVKCKYGNWNGYSKRQNIFMKSNETPDVMQINYSWLSEYSPDGEGFYDINTLSDYIDLSNYKDIELSYGTVNGKLNALPIAFNSETVYYNKDVFDKYGLDLPKTWDDYFAAAKVMSKDGVYPMAMGEKAMFFFLLSYFEQTTGNSACDENGNLILTRDDIKYMLTFYKRLFDEKVIIPVDRYNINYFLTLKAAGVVGWVSDANSYCSTLVESGADIVVGSYPVAEGAKKLGWYIKPATLYAISKTTEEPVAAAKLLNFLLNSTEMAELQKTEKGIPISDTAQQYLVDNNLLDGLVYEANNQMSDNQEKMSVMAPVLEQENVYISFKDDATYYLYGKKSLDEVTEMIYNDFYEQ